MKKVIAAVLSAAMIFALCACDTLDKLKNVDLPELPAITPTPAEERVETEAEAAIELAVEELTNYLTVNIQKTKKLFYDPQNGDKLILTFAYDNPKVVIDGREAAASKINEYLGMLDETYYTGNDYGAGTSYGVNLLYELAIDNYTYLYNAGVKDGRTELVSSREASVARGDNAVLSVVFNDYVYINPNEETHEYKAYNFDTVTGELLTLENITADYNKLASFVTDYMAELAQREEYKEIFKTADIKNFVNVISPIVREGSWFFGSTGMEFFTQKDEICAESGIVRFIIPYADLMGKINTSLIPAERRGNGKAGIMMQSDYKDGSMEIIDLVNIKDGGEGLMLVADGTIYDVSFSSVAYSSISGSFMTTAEHWFCSFMQDNAVQICDVIPEGMPTLMISYRTGSGDLVQKLVTESGEDGSIILMNTDIEAVG